MIFFFLIFLKILLGSGCKNQSSIQNSAISKTQGFRRSGTGQKLLNRKGLTRAKHKETQNILWLLPTIRAEFVLEFHGAHFQKATKFSTKY